MASLTLDLFTHAFGDVEAAQYRVLAAIDAVSKELRKVRLYPMLSELIETAAVLETIDRQSDTIRKHGPRSLTGVDVEHTRLLYEASMHDANEIARMMDLVAWALPQVKTLADQGVAMFDFVNDHMRLDAVGIVPLYKDEGYVLVPDHDREILHIIRYEMSLIAANDGQYRAMRTVELDSRDLGGIEPTPESIKLELIRSHTDLPNPATYVCDVDVELPFDETVLPVAKRKLMRYLIS
jgi:hypothetical protein